MRRRPSPRRMAKSPSSSGWTTATRSAWTSTPRSPALATKPWSPSVRPSARDWCHRSRRRSGPLGAARPREPRQYTSDAFQDELFFLGIESSPAFVRALEGNGCAERLIHTLRRAGHRHRGHRQSQCSRSAWRRLPESTRAARPQSLAAAAPLLPTPGPAGVLQHRVQERPRCPSPRDAAPARQCCRQLGRDRT
jgi:hypothetical protein